MLCGRNLFGMRLDECSGPRRSARESQIANSKAGSPNKLLTCNLQPATCNLQPATVTDWNERYVLGDTPWDKGAPPPPLLSWMARYVPLTGDVLVPDCAFGHTLRPLRYRTPCPPLLLPQP